MVVVGSGMANASVIYSVVSITPSGPNFDSKYIAQLTSDGQLKVSATDFAGLTPATTIEVAGTLPPTVQTDTHTIDIISTFKQLGTFAFHTAQGDLSDGTINGGTGEIEAPGTITGLPEPTTMLLMGGGLLGLGLIGKRFKKR